MMKNLLFLLFCTFSMIGFSQEIIVEETIDSTFVQKEIDSIIYDKNIDFEKERIFDTGFKDSYSGDEFTYIDDVEEEKKKEEKKEEKTDSPPTDLGILKGFAYFMSTIFPFLLGLIVVLIILKVFLGSETNFWSFKKSPKKVTEKLVYEDEDIDETDFNKLLARAILNKEYRQATRYYYLLLLKKLTQKKHIEYHKDKTNSEYLFEIENKEISKQFSYLSYIYTYVWYGEFMIDEAKFKTIENKYKSFLKTIH